MRRPPASTGCARHVPIRYRASNRRAARDQQDLPRARRPVLRALLPRAAPRSRPAAVGRASRRVPRASVAEMRVVRDLEELAGLYGGSRSAPSRRCRDRVSFRPAPGAPLRQHARHMVASHSFRDPRSLAKNEWRPLAETPTRARRAKRRAPCAPSTPSRPGTLAGPEDFRWMKSRMSPRVLLATLGTRLGDAAAGARAKASRSSSSAARCHKAYRS